MADHLGLAALLVVLAGGAPGAGQTPAAVATPQTPQTPTFRVNVEYVEVDAVVTGADVMVVDITTTVTSDEGTVLVKTGEARDSSELQC